MIASLWSILGFRSIAGKLVPLCGSGIGTISLENATLANSQNILYPSEGGFGSFMDGLAEWD